MIGSRAALRGQSGHGPAPQPIVLPCASARARLQPQLALPCACSVVCSAHAARLRGVLLAHLGVHGRCGLARRTPSCVGIDDDDLACRIRLAQRVLPLVYALKADDGAAKVRPWLPRLPLLVDHEAYREHEQRVGRKK